MKKIICIAAALIMSLSSSTAVYAADPIGETLPVGEGSTDPTDPTEPAEPTEPEKPIVRKNQKITVKKSFARKYGNNKTFSLKAKAKGGVKLSYKSGNKKVVTVSKKGKVTIKGCGKTTITITAKKTKYYKSAKKKVTVTVKPSKLKFTGRKIYSAGYINKLDLYFTPQKNCSGYEAKLSFVSNFKNWLFFTAKKNSKGMTFNVGRGRTYYIAVRAYKKIDGKRYNGKWAITTVRT